MDTSKPIVNKVAQKALLTINLEDFFPPQEALRVIDLKDYLFKGLILKEADFREAVKNTDWRAYQNQYVVLHCSADAVVPMWAYMVLSAELAPFAKDIVCSSPEHASEILLYRAIAQMDMAPYSRQRVVIKGCGARPVPEAAYVQLTRQLAQVARVILYGEPCSTVPVFKKADNE